MEEKCYRLYFEGVVQGVGFRYTARRIAQKYGVKGWALNLPDGRVEILAQGQESTICDFIDAVKETFLSHIRNVARQDVPLREEMEGFHIKFRM